MPGINNNKDKDKDKDKDKEPLPEIPIPVLNDPKPAPDRDQVVSAFKTLEPSRDLSMMTRSPCAKEAFVDGAAFGFGAGLLKAMKSGVGRPAANWGFGAFVLASIGTWEYCHYKLRQKRQLMATGQMPVVSTIDVDAAKRREAIAARQRDV
ncbi:hypothetical protein BGZ65_006639 [Modicella reniformis]|uniref:Cytochrome c oxidase assembly protein COX20, mitochondrial n=1 Tax=Modicella reniformis TaxID=1440133 RepID=A0A9P6JHP5_9FUNG|nr:hypothetical protein BGZ65_006639 [Modicella reniformis]